MADNIDALIAEWERSKAGMFEGSFTEAGDALAAALTEQSQQREAAERELTAVVNEAIRNKGRAIDAEVALATARTDLDRIADLACLVYGDYDDAQGTLETIHSLAAYRAAAATEGEAHE